AVAGLSAGAWLLLRDDGPRPPEDTVVQRPADLPPRELTATEIADPAEARRAAEREEARSRYASLRTSFGDGNPPSPATLARLAPVLRRIWPAGTLPVTAACTGQLCRVDAGAPATAWQAQLTSNPAIDELAERVAVDPDGAASAAYLVLLPAAAAAGGSVLDAVEDEFRRSTEIRECLSRAGATGSIEYVVAVDATGYSYRSQADLPGAVIDCADRVLGEILDRHPPPRVVQPASRTLALRR
ncbi:MAG: hypothetical protein WB493_00470, partial [Anaeromyxobacteraceae bacterium]